MTGKFITFEGGEGSGKTTQIRRLSDYLTEKNIPHITTREPGGSPGAEDIRSILVQGDADRWTPITELLLMYASRADHWHKRIQPALMKDTWVISDRFADSSLAYQGYGRGLDRDFIQSLYTQIVGTIQPNLTLILDIEPDEGIYRSKARLQYDASNEGRFETLDLAFHKRIREGFLEIAASDPTRCHVIDAKMSMDIVFQRIIEKISNLID
jgi:dTMP kinase